MAYEIQLKDTEAEVVDADGYTQEGVLTTFFEGRDGRAVLDSWAKRIASYRTADVIRIRWTAPFGERQRELDPPKYDAAQGELRIAADPVCGCAVQRLARSHGRPSRLRAPLTPVGSATPRLRHRSPDGRGADVRPGQAAVGHADLCVSRRLPGKRQSRLSTLRRRTAAIPQPLTIGVAPQLDAV